jgi:hypothetical protein
MAAEHELSARAAQRRDALLPDLLDSLRGRVRRARRRRLTLAAVALVLLAVLLPWSPADVPAARPTAPLATGPAWTECRDDPDVVGRCTVATVVRGAWFVGDDDLQALLHDADRPAGLVRTGARVLVAAAAVDPWPGETP